MSTTARDVETVLAHRYTLTEKGAAATDEHSNLTALIAGAVEAGHRITVTEGPFGRAYVDCTCSERAYNFLAVLPSKAAANIAAIAHAREVTR